MGLEPSCPIFPILQVATGSKTRLKHTGFHNQGFTKGDRKKPPSPVLSVYDQVMSKVCKKSEAKRQCFCSKQD